MVGRLRWLASKGGGWGVSERRVGVQGVASDHWLVARDREKRRAGPPPGLGSRENK